MILGELICSVSVIATSLAKLVGMFFVWVIT